MPSDFLVGMLLGLCFLSSFSRADAANPFDPRILGGEEALPYQFPWFAFIFAYDGQGNPYGSCGGSLVDPNYVLTAAHCCFCSRPTDSTFEIFLNLQETNYLNFSAPALPDQCTEIHKTSTRTCHPDWRSGAPENDFCLIKLETPSKYTPAVIYGTTKQTFVPALDAYQQDLAITGFGVYGAEDRISDTLQKATISVANTSRCVEKYAEYAVTIDPAVLLCGNNTAKDTDTCQGDSGGPLFTYKSNRFYLVGVVALGGSGCQAGNVVDSLYGRVNTNSFRNFLLSVTATSTPSRRPTFQPSKKATKAPSARRTKAPTPDPTKRPSKQPTDKPTKAPSRFPTSAGDTREPTAMPTKRPTKVPTFRATRSPVTKKPSREPVTKKPTPLPSTRSPTTTRPSRAPTFSRVCNNPRF